MISAVIVLYSPDIFHLQKFINELLEQVDKIILVDNTPIMVRSYDKSRFSSENIIYLDLSDNYGIAKAQNIGIKKALELNSEYIVIFDQDSSVSEDFISGLLNIDKALRVDGLKIAAVGPAFIDIKTNLLAPVIQFDGLKVNKITPKNDELYTRADFIISSGSLLHKSVFSKIGLMMEDLFIDFVDIEWGLRANKLGYHCYVANKIIMEHSIGDRSFKLPFLNKHVNIHSDFRRYFIIRNAIFLILYSNLQISWRLAQIPKTLQYFGFLILFVPPRYKNIKVFFKAFKDAVFKNMGKGSM